MANDLDVHAEIETPTGWLELEDIANGYELHAESFSQRQVQSRKVEADGEWANGSYTVRATVGNVVETVSVWVKAPSPFDLAERLDPLLAGLHQLQFRFRVTTGNLREEWVCQYSDYTIESDQNLRFATLALVKAQVPRLPDLVRTMVP